jgi:hypothetical protein
MKTSETYVIYFELNFIQAEICLSAKHWPYNVSVGVWKQLSAYQ